MRREHETVEPKDVVDHSRRWVHDSEFENLLQRREGCVFWKWEDPEMCMRSKMIIPGLLRRVNAAEAEIEKLRASVKKQNYRLVILISILCMMLAWKMAGQL
ncbi:hypothetical protein ACS0TY_004098 [Phlomoides rotata]